LTSADSGARPRRDALRGQVLLVVGAADRADRAVALHASAHGAAVVLAGPSLAEIVRLAGEVASSGGRVRVVETPTPPAAPADVVRLATEAFDAPTAIAVGADASGEAPPPVLAAYRLAAPRAVVIAVDAPRAPGADAEAVNRVAARVVDVLRGKVAPPP
jgi:hypothetical protein